MIFGFADKQFGIAFPGQAASLFIALLVDVTL